MALPTPRRLHSSSRCHGSHPPRHGGSMAPGKSRRPHPSEELVPHSVEGGTQFPLPEHRTSAPNGAGFWSCPVWRGGGERSISVRGKHHQLVASLTGNRSHSLAVHKMTQPTEPPGRANTNCIPEKYIFMTVTPVWERIPAFYTLGEGK